MQRRTWAFVVFGCAIGAGCAAIAGIEETTTIAPDTGDVGSEGGPRDDAGATADAGIDELPDAGDPLVDASLCADAAARVRGSSAVEVKTNNGVICPGPERILDLDDRGVALDSNGISGATRWPDGAGNDRTVHGCVGVQLDGGISGVLVRARMTGQGCETNCVAEDGGCNTYRYAGVWLRLPDDAGMRLVGTPQFDRGTFSERVVLLADGGAIDDPFVVVCRTSLADRRDDIDVDYLGGCR